MKKSIEVGLEPTTSGSEVQRAIHCATRPGSENYSTFYYKKKTNKSCYKTNCFSYFTFKLSNALITLL